MRIEGYVTAKIGYNRKFLGGRGVRVGGDLKVTGT